MISQEAHSHPNLLELPSVQAIDLFCGAGGLTRGLSEAGIDVRLGVDTDPACAFPYETNNRRAKFLHKSVADISGKELEQYFSKDSWTLLAGCAPCQTFSSYNRKKPSFDDPKWRMLDHFKRLINELSPDFVTMENVPRLKARSVYKDFCANLESQNYKIWAEVVDCTKYGIAQTRQRLVLLASRHFDPSFLSQEEFGQPLRTVRDVIYGLTEISAGATDPKDSLHSAASLSDINIQRMHAAKPGKTWRDWPDEIIADCHKHPKGREYLSVYGRMEWDKPAPTLTTNYYSFGTGRFGHPEQHRALSLREGALIQGFPADYEFVPQGALPVRKTIGRMVGNAVPVPLGKAIGQSLLHQVQHTDTLRTKIYKGFRNE
ncbi:MAG: DNA cytosine methyltransferase [Alphaproteobacteria bacterium]|nr:DNA cytosine methyltransferase [Alphaproteobacteria bacterium]